MNTNRSPLQPAGAADRNQAALRRRLVTTVLACAVVATAEPGPVAYASPAPETGPTVTVTTSPAADEVAYVSSVRRHLDLAKRYPTGREASLSRPSGTATVWVEVARDGRPVGRGLARSSGSGLLDWTATNLVGRADYPAFPADAWTDGPTHRFLVSYRFDAVAGEPDSAQVEVAVDR